MAPRFTLAQIEQAHQGVTIAGVRDYLEKLYALGVVSYTSHISDGHSDYLDSKGDSLSSAPVHEIYEISGTANPEHAREAVAAHGLGKTDYLSFSRQLANAGVATWVMDPVGMTCSFHSKAGDRLFIEEV